MKPNIGENIKKLRNEKQVTQEQLAAHLSISSQSVSKWENNVNTPDIFLLPAIAEYFEVQIDELFKINMVGYKNKAQRLFSKYESTGKKEDFEKADAEYEKLFTSNQADARDICDCGTLNQYHSNKLTRKAEQLFRQAITLGETKAEDQLMTLLADRSRGHEYISKYEEILRNDPANEENWCMLVNALCANYDPHDNLEKAYETAKKGLEIFPNSASLLGYCGNICKALKRYDEAFAYWNESNELKPFEIGHCYFVAYAYEEVGRYKEAIKTWEKISNSLEERGFPEEKTSIDHTIKRLQSCV